GLGHGPDAQDQIARGDVQTERIAEEGHVPLLPTVCGALRGELVDVAHRVAGLERAQPDVGGHRLHVKPWVEWIDEFDYERVLEQVLRTIVDADKLVVREVKEGSGAGRKLRLECAHAELEAGPGGRGEIGMDDRCREGRLGLGGLRYAGLIAPGRHADQPDFQGRNVWVHSDRYRDGSVVGEVLLPGGQGDELLDRAWIRVAGVGANPGRDADAAVAVGFGQRGREGAIDIGRAAGLVRTLAREVEILRALLRRGKGARHRVSIV